MPITLRGVPRPESEPPSGWLDQRTGDRGQIEEGPKKPLAD